MLHSTKEAYLRTSLYLLLIIYNSVKKIIEKYEPSMVCWKAVSTIRSFCCCCSLAYLLPRQKGSAWLSLINKLAYHRIGWHLPTKLPWCLWKLPRKDYALFINFRWFLDKQRIYKDSIQILSVRNVLAYAITESSKFCLSILFPIQ